MYQIEDIATFADKNNNRSTKKKASVERVSGYVRGGKYIAPTKRTRNLNVLQREKKDRTNWGLIGGIGAGVVGLGAIAAVAAGSSKGGGGGAVKQVSEVVSQTPKSIKPPTQIADIAPKVQPPPSQPRQTIDLQQTPKPFTPPIQVEDLQRSTPPTTPFTFTPLPTRPSAQYRITGDRIVQEPPIITPPQIKPNFAPSQEFPGYRTFPNIEGRNIVTTEAVRGKAQGTYEQDILSINDPAFKGYPPNFIYDTQGNRVISEEILTRMIPGRGTTKGTNFVLYNMNEFGSQADAIRGAVRTIEEIHPYPPGRNQITVRPITESTRAIARESGEETAKGFFVPVKPEAYPVVGSEQFRLPAQIELKKGGKTGNTIAAFYHESGHQIDTQMAYDLRRYTKDPNPKPILHASEDPDHWAKGLVDRVRAMPNHQQAMSKLKPRDSAYFNSNQEIFSHYMGLYYLRESKQVVPARIKNLEKLLQARSRRTLTPVDIEAYSRELKQLKDLAKTFPEAERTFAFSTAYPILRENGKQWKEISNYIRNQINLPYWGQNFQGLRYQDPRQLNFNAMYQVKDIAEFQEQKINGL